ncbi:glucose-6-phosphate dehydrogenase [Sphingomonas aquatica]|uniref:glucose-6-phosphate dehydrogenase n=1 Tax=Sphingomonas aquatica TaxID=1763824 RepID=UPI00301CE470
MPGRPATIVIFGATGDLTRRLLVPALANLCFDGLLSEELNVIGIALRDGDDESLRVSLDEFAPQTQCWQRLRQRTSYLPGDFTLGTVYERLKQRLGEDDAAFYLATPPQFFGVIVDRLADAGLTEEHDGGFRRVVIEKPFGHDLESARALNQRILSRVNESQVYRIDHFLGKETVQNILVARFGNAWLEAVWNHRYVDHIQISAAEAIGVGTRGAFYDTTGALRDMVPNHLMQLLSMIAMEPPNSFDAEVIRDEKAKLLRAVRRITPDEARSDAVRGMYAAGQVNGQMIPAYRETPHVDPNTATETYVALKLMVDTWRWTGVPFYLRTGKALAARDTEIVVTFKPVPYATFRETPVAPLPANQLVFQIQPHEGIDLGFLVKRPGPQVEAVPVALDFAYAEKFAVAHRTGYETLLYDMMMGDQTLFQRADQIEAGWAVVQPILDAWARGEGVLEEYTPGTSGPRAADALIARDGRQWHALGR